MKNLARPKTPQRGNSIGILLIVDDPQLAGFLQQHLAQITSSRYTVHHVRRFDEALRLLASRDFDILALDLAQRDGGPGGLDGLAQLRAAAPDLPIILLCSADGHDLALQAVSMGAEDFVNRDMVSADALDHAVRLALERKRRASKERAATQSLRFEHERLLSLLANIDVSLIIFDAGGHLAFVNDSWVRRNHIPREAALGRRYDEITEYHIAPDVQATVDRVFSTGQATQFQEWFYQDANHPNGIYVDGSIMPMLDTEDRVAGAMAISIDVTEKVRARREVEAQKAISDTILAESPVGVVLFDLDMRITHLNAQYARIAGLDPSTARGQMIYDYFPGSRRRAAIHRRVLAGEGVDLPNIASRNPLTGGARYYDVYYRPVRDASGEVTGVVGVVVDVTERHESERQKDEFLALASHELRTPVTSIWGFAQLAMKTAERLGDERLIRSLSVIKEQATHLSRIVNDLLDVSRIENGGEMPLHRQRFDLGDLVSDSALDLKLTEPDVDIALNVPQKPALVHADPHLIGEVMTNLLDNAVKYSRKAGPIEVEVSPNGKEVMTAVRDHGVGIPLDQQARIFDRFYRATNATSLPRNGLGLGLYLARDIVTRHGGRIWCESTQEGGSTFYFSLPLA